MWAGQKVAIGGLVAEEQVQMWAGQKVAIGGLVAEELAAAEVVKK